MNLHGSVWAAKMEGTAKVVVSLDSWPEGKVGRTAHDITVLPPKKGREAEPLSPLLIKTLPHPDRKAVIGQVLFSPDGTRLLAAGYPSGVVQLWDTKGWKEAGRMQTPSGLRNTWAYAVPTSDWKAVLVHARTRKPVREEKGGKIVQRVQVDGRIDAYDGKTGKVRDTIPFAGRGPMQLFLAPGGRFALVNTEVSFAGTDPVRPQTLEVVDLQRKTATKLLDTSASPAFAPDGKTVYLAKVQIQPDGRAVSGLLKYDLAAGKELLSVR
ncbi:MAG: YncE family protein, partial [Gemmataceae bacterium]